MLPAVSARRRRFVRGGRAISPSISPVVGPPWVGGVCRATPRSRPHVGRIVVPAAQLPGHGAPDTGRRRAFAAGVVCSGRRRHAPAVLAPASSADNYSMPQPLAEGSFTAGPVSTQRHRERGREHGEGTRRDSKPYPSVFSPSLSVSLW